MTKDLLKAGVKSQRAQVYLGRTKWHIIILEIAAAYHVALMRE